jgi:hypothetical protein
MDVAGASSAVLLIVISLVQALLAFLVVSYAGYSFLTVFVNTSAGSDEVIWPKDPFQDWIFKSWYLAWLLAVWAIPAWLIANLLDPSIEILVLIIGGFLWLMFPIGLLSSLSASSRWVVIRPVILGTFLGNITSSIAFYTITGLLLASCVFLLYEAISGPFYFVPLAAFVSASAFLIYSRLLGRIGWVFTQQHEDEQLADEEESPPATKPRADPKSGSAGGRTPKRKNTPSDRRSAGRDQDRSPDPWASSLEEALRKGSKPAPHVPRSDSEDPYGPASGSYEVLPEERSWQKLSSRRDPESPIQPFPLSPASEKQSPKYPAFELPEPDEPPGGPKRRGTNIRHEVPPAPSWPLWSGVYSFPFYPTTLGAFAVLAIGLLGMVILLRTQLDLFHSLLEPGAR